MSNLYTNFGSGHETSHLRASVDGGGGAGGARLVNCPAAKVSLGIYGDLGFRV
jgi:hypothetical protein